MLSKSWKPGPLEIKKVTARFATKFAISLQVVSMHVKAFSQQFGKPTKKTDLVVCYLHCASSNSSRRDNRLRTGVNGESFASCRYETEFGSLLALWRRLSWELATARGDSCLEKKKKVVACLAFTSSTKRENRHFRVVVVQWRQRNVNWKSVMHVQSCCFPDLNPLLSCHSRSNCRRLCLRKRVKSIAFRLFPPFSLNI